MAARRVLRTELSLLPNLSGLCEKGVSQCWHLWRKRGEGKSEVREKHRRGWVGEKRAEERENNDTPTPALPAS